ncbi:MAG: DUF3943 domain-containing protein [Thermoanaerobaculia bacterium]
MIRARGGRCLLRGTIAFALSSLLARGALGEETASAPAFHLFDPPPGTDGAPAKSSAKPKRRWALAVGELAALEVIPWANDRYLQNQDYAYISWQTVAANLRAGLTLEDMDKFTTDQLGHPIHGGLYFNAARTNGFTFWESIGFSAVGAYVWQMAMERDAHSLNDFVTTTMGGPTIGEPMFRLSRMIYDNEARGTERVLREIAGAFVNPTAGFTRLFTGEMWRVEKNPEDRFPSLFVLFFDGGYRHIGHNRIPDQDQGLVSVALRYGDPFLPEGDPKPFDFFELSLDLSSPSSAWLTRIQIRGLAAGWGVGRSATSEHLLGVLFEFDYFNNEPRQFGLQAIKAGLLSRFDLGKEVDLRTEALLVGAPLASLYAGHGEASAILVGRSFGWGPAAGIDATARLRRHDIDLLTLNYTLYWVHATSGIARNSTLQAVTTEARFPFGRHFALGGGWSLSQRLSTFDAFPTDRVTSPTWRAFASWTFH